MIEAMETAVVRRETRWTTQDELSAQTLELLHAHYLLTAKANGAKQVGQSLHVPRPHEVREKPTAISPGDFARRLRSQ